MIGLGHDVIAREIYVKEVGVTTAREQPDVAIVGLGLSSEHALDLIAEIVREASCPVIALLHASDPAYIREAAKRGVFAYIVDGTPEELQSAIDITLQRFTEYHNLQGAFGRRAVIEQAKGILMARHSIDAGMAFQMLRDHSQHNGRKVADVAAAIVESHLLLLPARTAGPERRVTAGLIAVEAIRASAAHDGSPGDGARSPARLAVAREDDTREGRGALDRKGLDEGITEAEEAREEAAAEIAEGATRCQEAGGVYERVARRLSRGRRAGLGAASTQ